MHLFFELKVGFSNFQGIRLTVKHNVLMKRNEKPPLREKLSRGVGLEGAVWICYHRIQSITLDSYQIVLNCLLDHDQLFLR